LRNGSGAFRFPVPAGVSILLRGNGVAQLGMDKKYHSERNRFNPLARQRGCATSSWLLPQEVGNLVSILLRGNGVAQRDDTMKIWLFPQDGFNPLARQRGCATMSLRKFFQLTFRVFQSSCEATGLRNQYSLNGRQNFWQFQSSCEATGLRNCYSSQALPPGASFQSSCEATGLRNIKTVPNVAGVVGGFQSSCEATGLRNHHAKNKQEVASGFNPLARQRGCAT